MEGESFLSQSGQPRWQAPAFQAQLMELLALRTQRYTMGEHSSVPVELAQELFTSLCFVIGARLELGPGTGPDAPVAQLFQEGLELVRGMLLPARRLYERLCAAVDPVGNLALRDTLENMAVFFRAYDPDFFAHQIPCDIDYPLCDPVPEGLAGVRFVMEYLRRLDLENRLVRALPRQRVEAVLAASVPDHRAQLINLADLVFPGACGLALLGREPRELWVTPRDREHLRDLLGDSSREAVAANLAAGGRKLAAALGLTKPGLADYLARCGEGLEPRVWHALEAGGLEGVFRSAEG